MSSTQISIPGGSITGTMVSAYAAPAFTMTSGNGAPGTALRFIGTGLRLPSGTLTKSGNNYVAGDMVMGMPDFEVTEITFGFAAFGLNSSSEVHCPNGYTVEGIATKNGAGARSLGQMDGASDPIVIDPSDPSMTNGRLIRFTPTAPIAAGALQVFSFAEFIPDGLYPRTRTGRVAGPNAFGGTSTGERSQGSASSLASTLSGSTVYNQSGGPIIYPSMALARGPGGQKSVLILGTSIPFGANQASDARLWTDRHEFGFLSMGLDDNVQSERVPFLNWCAPGWGSESSGQTNSQADATACARQLWLMNKARELNGGRALCTHIWSEHGTNTSGTASEVIQGYRDLFELWTPVAGDDATIIHQTEMLPYPTSTDGFATTVNQTPSPARDYPSGAHWVVNEAIGGPDGLGDPTATLRADGTIDGSFAPWRVSAVDTGSSRDLLSVRAETNTLASDYAGTGTISLVSEPTLGVYYSIRDGTNTADFIVLDYTGSGPYVCNVLKTSGGSTGFLASNAVIREMWHDIGGLHPGPLAHKEYVEGSVIPFKVSLGWTAPLAITSSPSASVDSGQTLSFALTANKASTWSIIGGADQAQFNIASSELQWVGDGTQNFASPADVDTNNTYIVQVRATSGGETADQTITITVSEGSVFASLKALLDNNTNCAAYDLTTASTPSPWSDETNNANDLNGIFNRGFQSISATDGGELNAGGHQFDPDNTAASGNVTAILRIKVDDSDNDLFLTPEIRVHSTGSPPTPLFIDGVAMATNADALAALDGGGSHTVRMTDLPDSSIGRSSAGQGWVGFLRRLVYIDEAVVTGSDYTDAVAQAETWVAET